MRRIKGVGIRGLVVGAVLGLALLGGGFGHHSAPVAHADGGWCIGC
jgi:hypothetical protein